MPLSLLGYWKKIRSALFSLEDAIQAVLFLVTLLFLLAIATAALIYYHETLPLTQEIPKADFKSKELSISDLDQVIKLLDARTDQFTSSSTPPGILGSLR